MKKLFRWLTTCPSACFVCLFWFLGCLWNVSFNVLVMGELMFPSESRGIYDYILIILVAPFVETAVFQAFPYYVLRRFHFFRIRLWALILVSGLFFAIQHFYSIEYILFAFVPGCLLITGYHLRQGKHAFLTISGVHFAINATPLIYEFLFRRVLS